MSGSPASGTTPSPSRVSAAEVIRAARELVERDPGAALARADQAVALSGSARTTTWAAAVRVRALLYTGRTAEAMLLAGPLPRRFRVLGEHAGAAYVLTDLSALLMVAGRFPEAGAAIAAGLVAAQRGGDRGCQAHLLQNRAVVSILSRDLDRAEREARAGLDVALDLGADAETSHFQLAEIDLLRVAEEPWRRDRTRLVDDALDHAARGVAIAGPGRLLVEALRWETEALAWAGERDAALDRGLQASHLADRHDGEALAVGRTSRALGYAAAGMRGEAIGTIREAARTAAPGGWAAVDAGRVHRDLICGALGSG